MILRILLAGALCVLSALAADFPITVYLVRHAERVEGMMNDPGLSPAGVTRANKLASMLADKKVTAIYSSNFARTKMTAKPLADKNHITINDGISPGKPLDIASAIFNGRDRVVLVVGHSNTIPPLIAALGATIPAIPESEFDNFYVVTVEAAGKATVKASKY